MGRLWDWLLGRMRASPQVESKSKSESKGAMAVMELPSPRGRKTFAEISRSPYSVQARSSYLRMRDRALPEALRMSREELRLAEGYADPDDRVDGHHIQYREVAVRGEVAAPISSVRAIEESRYLFKKSPLKAACDNLTARYTAGNGLEVAFEDPDAQAVWDEFLSDNECLSDIEALAKRYRIDGQLLLLSDISPSGPGVQGGRVRLRRWDPTAIVSARFEDRDPERPESLRIMGASSPVPERVADIDVEENGLSSGMPEATEWTVVRQRDGGDVRYPSTRQGLVTDGRPLVDGRALWFRANMVESDWGRPDGCAGFHLADQYDETRAQSIQAVRIKNTYAIKFRLEGYTDSDIDEYKARMTIPNGVAAYYCNEKSDIEQIRFDSGANQIEEHLLGVKKLFLALYGLTPSAVAEELDATFAGAVAAQTPMRKALQAKQSEVVRMVEGIARFVVDTAVWHGLLPPSISRAFTVNPSPLSADESATQAGTLNATALALSQLVGNSLLSEELARMVAERAVVQTGLVSQDEVAAAAEDVDTTDSVISDIVTAMGGGDGPPS